MLSQPIINPELQTEVALHSRKANRRTLKGCVTQAERIQQQIRNVGMQYVTVNPTVFKALHFQHQLLEEVKKALARAGNAL